MEDHRITSNPSVMSGQACIRGTRIPVAVILDNLASGRSSDDIIADYPSLETADVRAAVAYGAKLARDQFVDLSIEAA